MTERMDQFDRNILDILQRDCQRKAETIAAMVGLSPSAVQRRLKRLRAEGIITARDVEHYDDISAQLMSENPQIKRMHTNVVLRDIKTSLHIPIKD